MSILGIAFGVGGGHGFLSTALGKALDKALDKLLDGRDKGARDAVRNALRRNHGDLQAAAANLSKEAREAEREGKYHKAGALRDAADSLRHLNNWHQACHGGHSHLHSRS